LPRKQFRAVQPKAFTRIKTSLFFGMGTGRLSILRTSGLPASRITAAFIVAIGGPSGSQARGGFVVEKQ
jgi:hypothetical protein